LGLTFIRKTGVYADFTAVFSECEISIRSYLMACTRDVHAAEDLYQEVSILLWKKFDLWDSSLPFLPWALGFARNVAMKHRGRRRDLQMLDDQTIEILENTILTKYKAPENHMMEALEKCMDSLKPEFSEMLSLKYKLNASMDQISKQYNKSLSTVKVSIMRARHQLKKCIERRTTGA
jgi:RNA polymerase sigma-70 factor, ECF subfamily